MSDRNLAKGLTPKLKRVIGLAKQIADEFGHEFTGTEHMLVALIRTNSGITGSILSNAGVTESKIREAVGVSTDKTSIYDQETVPQSFITRYIWWALRYSPSVSGVRDADGSLIKPLPSKEDIHPDAIAQLIGECQEFWNLSKGILKSACAKWNAKFQLEGMVEGGSEFFWARHGDSFFLTHWPEKERKQFLEEASKFLPMVLAKLVEDDGKFHFFDGPDYLIKKENNEN